MILLSDRTCDYYFALCVVLLITFQFWYGAPHISFYENTEEMSKSHLYVGSSSMPAGWTIYMCAKEKTNNMSYDVSVIEKSKKVFTRTILGNASKMPIPTITKPPLGGILSYVLSKAQMEDLENNPQIEQVFVEPLMHCLEPVKFCSKNTKQHKLITNEIQCLAIANPNNYEVRVDFMVNFHVTNTQSQIDDGDDNKNINNDNYNNNDDDYNNSYYNNDEDVIMRDSSRTEDTHNSDSTTYGGSGYNENNLKTVCEIAENQEKNIVSLHPTINKRFEIFCIKLGQIDLFKLLVHKFYESGCTSVTGTWDEPLSLNTGYLTDPDFKEYVELFDKYKEITLYFTEGLDRVNSDEYRNALAYFKYAINLENDWINDLFVKDKKGESMKLNGEKLRRSKEIDAYAKACLKVDHDGLLSKIRHEPYRTRGLKDGLQTLPYIVAYIGASNCAEDELFKRFRDEFKELIEGVDFTEEQQSLIHNLLEKYTQPEESLELKPSDEVEPDANLCERYEAALKKCSSGLKSYEVPYII